MRTDLQNLNAYKSAVVVFIASGVMLMAGLIYSDISPEHRSNLLAGIKMLDAHEQVSQTIESMNLILGLQQEFLSQFYTAFTQVAALPEGIFEVPESYAQTWQKQFSPWKTIAYGARVAGTMIELTNSFKNLSPAKSPQESSGPPEKNIPYSFAPPEWQPIKQTLIKIWAQ